VRRSGIVGADGGADGVRGGQLRGGRSSILYSPSTEVGVNGKDTRAGEEGEVGSSNGRVGLGLALGSELGMGRVREEGINRDGETLKEVDQESEISERDKSRRKTAGKGVTLTEK
jgi:hypothetical protein